VKTHGVTASALGLDERYERDNFTFVSGGPWRRVLSVYNPKP